MRAEFVLPQLRALPVRGFEEAFSDGPILILAPHPDDESLGCGGLIAEACRRGVPPIIAILTDGSQSHPHSLAYPAERLRALREAEVRAATGELGVAPDRLVFLQYPDSGAPREGKPLADAALRLAGLIAHWDVRTVVVSWRHDPHSDHEAAAIIAELACRQTETRLLAYPVWGWTLPPEAELDTGPITGFRLEIGCHLPAKRAAIAAHQSQYAGLITDDPEGFQMPDDFIDRFLSQTETYIDVDLAP